MPTPAMPQTHEYPEGVVHHLNLPTRHEPPAFPEDATPEEIAMEIILLLQTCPLTTRLCSRLNTRLLRIVRLLQS